MTTTKEILIKAREIISDEKNWTQGIEARDKDGNTVAYFNPLAICFCSIGAVERAAFLTNGDPARALCALTTGGNLLFKHSHSQIQRQLIPCRSAGDV
jgi:hypothetical protein